ncbi:MAG: hypothetical protein HOW73_43350 [Polyangiaceae bacterium]|nr:hypothetical protein [Polyangiaceae bacterium]
MSAKILMVLQNDGDMCGACRFLDRGTFSSLARCRAFDVKLAEDEVEPWNPLRAQECRDAETKASALARHEQLRTELLVEHTKLIDDIAAVAQERNELLREKSARWKPGPAEDIATKGIRVIDRAAKWLAKKAKGDRS